MPTRPVRAARASRPLPTLRSLAAPLLLLAAACHESHAAGVDLVREPEPASPPPAPSPPAVPPANPLVTNASSAGATTTSALATSAAGTTHVAPQPPHASGTKRRPRPAVMHSHMVPGRMMIVSPSP